MTILSQQEARERVARGAALLDQRRPGWAVSVDVGNIEMATCWGCVLGQLYGAYADGAMSLGLMARRGGIDPAPMIAHGFFLEDNYANEVYRPLVDAWIEAIADRLVGPSALYVYSWDLENGKPPMKLYRVTGGKFDGSDVGAERLIELGITVPEPVEPTTATVNA